MNIINFNGIYVEGFRSCVKPVKFPLDNPGLNLLKGANGSGKTTLPAEALVWCLYRLNLKNVVDENVVSWPEIRDNDFQGTKVLVDFHVESTRYKIARHKDYKGETGGYKGGDKLMIFIDGDMHGDDLQKKDQQEFINRILGMDGRVFINTVIFGQRMDKLVEADNDEKRKLFEEMFDMYWIDDLRKKAQEDKDKIEIKIEALLKEKALYENTLENLINNLERDKEILEDFKIGKEEKLSDLGVDLGWLLEKKKETNDNIKAAEEQISQIEFDPEEYDKKLKEFADINNKQIEKETEYKNAKTVLETAINTHRDLINLLADTINDHKEAQEALQEHYDNMGDELRAFDEDIEELENRCETLKLDEQVTKEEYDKLLTPLQKTINEVHESISETKSSLKIGHAKIEEVQLSLKKLEESLKNRLKVCDKCNRELDKESEQYVYAKDIDKQTRYKQQLKQLNEDIDNLDSSLKKDEKLLKKLNSDVEQLQLQYTTYKKLKRAEEDLINWKKDREYLKSEDKVLIEKVNNLAKQVEGVEVRLKTAQKQADKQQELQHELQHELQMINKEYDRLEELTQDMEADKIRLEDLQENLKMDQNYLKEQEIKIKNLEDRIKEVNDQKPPNVNIKETEQKIHKKEKEAEQILEDIEKQTKKKETALWWINKGFRDLRGFVFAATLTDLNKRVVYYAERLGVSIKFTIDLNKASKPFKVICSLGDIYDKDYKDFSGGEKSRLDIALMFGMYDLISATNNTNIMILDEVFEGLDEEGETIVFDLIQSMAENKAIYVISHSAMLNSLYSNTIEFTRNEKRQTEIIF